MALYPERLLHSRPLAIPLMPMSQDSNTIRLEHYLMHGPPLALSVLASWQV